MGEEFRRDIRIQKRKDVADIVKDVLNDKQEASDIEASLHRFQSRVNKSDFLLREVLNEVLGSNLCLARTVRRLAATVEEQGREIAELKAAKSAA